MAETRPDRVLSPVDVEFWHHCGRRELRLQHCASCAGWSWPAVEACEHCGHQDLCWERVTGRGTLLSWCTFEHRYHHELPIPWDAILVELDEGPMFISNPIRLARDDFTAGMPLAVEFLACIDSHGEYLLPVFGPAT